MRTNESAGHGPQNKQVSLIERKQRNLPKPTTRQQSGRRDHSSTHHHQPKRKGSTSANLKPGGAKRPIQIGHAHQPLGSKTTPDSTRETGC